MKTAKSIFTLYTGFLLLLLLFPPWSERDQFDPPWIDPVFSSLGHHWRFSPPFHWGYIEPYSCVDSTGREATCRGMSVWEPNEAAFVDFAALKYEAVVGLVASAFLVLIVGWFGGLIRVGIPRFKSLTHWARRRTLKNR
jgi:hypothetical protein